jgi:hypothetical protein
VDDPFRIYEAADCSKDGYPRVWHDGLEERVGPDGKRVKFGVKHLVRELTDHRCARCGHPYRGGGQWSPCDGACTHRGPYRILYRSGEVARINSSGCAEAGFAVRSDPALVAGVEAEYRILTVHHLNGVKHDLRWWNLVALCQRCHLQIQGKVVMERVWPWEHSEWFKPYVAAYYASVYLGEEISREEAQERMEELLALERQA